MDWDYEVGVLSMLGGLKDRDEELSSISEFKQQLEEADDLAHEKLGWGWGFWRENERQQQILTLLQSISGYSCREHNLVQYWGVVKVEGRHHYLSTSHYPFWVGKLKKGICLYRKLCRDQVYVVDIDDDDQEQQQQLIGGVGRAYRKKHPESSPDLRLYSTNEFPMRDEAARCGFRAYLALPLFDLITSQCYGVLEFLTDDSSHLARKLDGPLQNAGFKSTYRSMSTSDFATKMQLQPGSKLREIIELAMATVPRLYLALVWAPCKEWCVNMMNTNLRCMQIGESFNYWSYRGDPDLYGYIEACTFQHLQIDVSCLDSSSVGDDQSISKNPLAHYAQKARINMSHSVAVSLQSLNNTNNHLYVIQFFLQPTKFREDGYYSLHLLSKILEMNLKRSFKLVSRGRLLSESQKPNAIECESIDSLNVFKSYKQKLSQLNFTTYLEMVESCCLRPSPKGSRQGWVFGINNNSLLVPYKIENFMNNIRFARREQYWIIQFWAPKMVENRCCLEALDQPYVVGCLSKGIASFRKKCMTHSYFVDDEAKEDELGPPGRVYRNGHPEISPDLFLYTTKEYPNRNYAMKCCTRSRGYFALPIFEDEHNHNCVGVLEFVGFSHLRFENIRKTLEAAKLCSNHTDLYPRLLVDIFNIYIYGREAALTEQSELATALVLISNNIPQLLHMANVWVPNGECVNTINSNISCMKLELSTSHSRYSSANEVQWIHVQTRKGMIGMVLASENKSCFCQNLCEFSIADQPLSHFEMSERREVCFAICLQSSHTGDLVYVVEFFLHQGPKTYEYLQSLLNFLLQIMKHELKSFKMASGKQLGEELVVEVIEFSDANKFCSSESEQTDVFPIKFKSVQYNQEEHQHSEEQQMEKCNAAAASDSKRRKSGKRKVEECSTVAASDSKTGAKGKSKPRRHLTHEDLEPLFHVEKLKDVRKMLNVSKATLYRAREKYGLLDWPGKLRNYPLPTDSQPSTSTSNIQPLDTNTESTHHVNNVEAEAKVEAEKMTIKATYGEDTIRLELCLPLEFSELTKQVAKKLNLEKGAFKLKYLDEDGGDILLTDDADLDICRNSQITLMHNTFIQLIVRITKKDIKEKGSCAVKNQDAIYVVDVDDVEEVLCYNSSPVVKAQKNKIKNHPKKPEKLEATDIPKYLKSLHSYARHALLDGASIKILMDGDVFHRERMIYLFFDDIHRMCELEAIPASCICIYIWYLYKKCKNANLLDRVRFVDPYEVSYDTKVDPEKKASIICQRLIGTLPNQVVLVPCNVCWHWILMVIDPYNDTVYVLDPLSMSSYIKEWMSIMTMAYTRFNMSIGKNGRSCPLWEVIKCQQQLDGKQCGFYVMRYMKDIIESCGFDRSILIPSLFSEGFYSHKEIDEVRTEWAEFVHDFTECL